MTPKQILKLITKNSGFTQERLAKVFGLAGASGVATRIMRADNMNISTFIDVANQLGYKVEIKKYGGEKYELTTEETEIPKVEVAPVRELNAEETKADMMKRLEELNR